MRLEAVETLESEGEALQSQMVLQIEGLRREVEDAGRASARLEEEIRGVVGQGVEDRVSRLEMRGNCSCPWAVFDDIVLLYFFYIVFLHISSFHPNVML